MLDLIKEKIKKIEPLRRCLSFVKRVATSWYFFMITGLETTGHILGRFFIHFMTARHLIGNLKMVLKSGELKSGVSFLKRKYPVVKPKAVQFLITLYRYALNLEQSFVLSNVGKNTLIVHFCCWGTTYAQKAKDYLLPSLLAAGNLPSIAKQYQITLLIHCDAITRQEIENSAVFHGIQDYATVTFVVLPHKLLKQYQSATHYFNFSLFKQVNHINQGLRYLLFGAMQSHALAIAVKQKALISFLIPDSCLSDYFFSYALSKIKDKIMVLSTTFRTDYFGVRTDLESFYTDGDPSSHAGLGMTWKVTDRVVLSVSGTEMSKLQVNYLHNTEKRRMIAVGTKDFLPCPRFIFKMPYGLTLRAVHYHPVLINCAPLKECFKIDYFPIDDSVIKQILKHDVPYEQQVWLCSDPAQMNFMELSDLHPEINDAQAQDVPSTYESLMYSIASLLKACPKDLDESIHRFFIGNELNFIVDEGCYIGDEIIDGHQFILDLYQRVDHA